MKPISKLKKELDKWFSLFIRLRRSNINGTAFCYTCNALKHFSNLQCGHFQSRRFLNTRWNEQNCEAQCVKCNMFDQGQQWIFGKKLGSELAQHLQDEARKTVKISRFEYLEKIVYYKNIVKKLKKEVATD